jgi:DNA sulfur modification protein DndE
MIINILKKISILSITIVVLIGRMQAQEKNEQYYIANAPFKMPSVVEPKFPDRNFSIKDYGAVGDGQVLNTAVFAKTIDACAKAGGGKVIVPAGLWLTGPIQLQSNINLHLERGAIIQFTSDHKEYPIIKSSASSNSFVVASPIYGYNLKNVAITGEGIMDGAGETWRPVKKIKTTAAQWKEFTANGVVSKDGEVWWPSKEAMEGEEYLKKLKLTNPKPAPEDYLPARDYLRPYMVYLVNCDNVLLEGVTIRNSPKFVFYPNSCTNLTMRYVNIFNEWWAQNGDGVDISACKNVLIYKCNVSAGDDGICMKSSGTVKVDEAKLENVLIAGCNVYHAHGGFVIGSNTDGGMRNIYVTDCNFIGTDVGVRVKSNAGRGGLVHDIYVRNIYMTDIATDAISFDTFYEDVPAGKVKDSLRTTLRDKTPVFRDFFFNDIYCKGAKTAISITGLHEMPVSKIMFENMIIESEKGYISTDATDIVLKKVKILPSKDPVYLFTDSRNILINGGFMPENMKSFIKAEGNSSGIRVSNTLLPKSKETVQIAGNTDKSSVTIN